MREYSVHEIFDKVKSFVKHLAWIKVSYSSIEVSHNLLRGGVHFCFDIQPGFEITHEQKVHFAMPSERMVSALVQDACPWNVRVRALPAFGEPELNIFSNNSLETSFVVPEIQLRVQVIATRHKLQDIPQCHSRNRDFHHASWEGLGIDKDQGCLHHQSWCERNRNIAFHRERWCSNRRLADCHLH
jgi:hypothetical protein